MIEFLIYLNTNLLAALLMAKRNSAKGNTYRRFHRARHGTRPSEFKIWRIAIMAGLTCVPFTIGMFAVLLGRKVLK